MYFFNVNLRYLFDLEVISKICSYGQIYAKDQIEPISSKSEEGERLMAKMYALRQILIQTTSICGKLVQRTSQNGILLPSSIV